MCVYILFNIYTFVCIDYIYIYMYCIHNIYIYVYAFTLYIIVYTIYITCSIQLDVKFTNDGGPGNSATQALLRLNQFACPHPSPGAGLRFSPWRSGGFHQQQPPLMLEYCHPSCGNMEMHSFDSYALDEGL